VLPFLRPTRQHCCMGNVETSAKKVDSGSAATHGAQRTVDRPKRVEPFPRAGEILDRLAARGIGVPQYAAIKRIVVLDLPQRTMFFERDYGRHTPAHVLRLASKWKKLLKTDFILRPVLSAELMTLIENAVHGAEIMAWSTLLETSLTHVGEWDVQLRWLPPIADRSSDTKIEAIQRITKERQTAIVPGSLDGRSWVQGLERAFQDLGLLRLILKPRKRRRLVSAERAKAWPIFTQFMVPRLYEFMLPSYSRPGHIGSKEKTLRRDAYYPGDLFADMLAILQLEHSDIFHDCTISQLKSAVQRHLERTQPILKPKTIFDSAK
jgi:hypothetical protein